MTHNLTFDPSKPHFLCQQYYIHSNVKMFLPERLQPRKSSRNAAFCGFSSPSPRQQLQLLKFVVALLLLVYFLSSASIFVNWKDMADKADGKASITTQIEYRSPRFQVESIWETHLGHLSAHQQSANTRDFEMATTEDSEEEHDEPRAQAKHPSAVWKKHEFHCLGWVKTDDDGDEVGRRECWQRVQRGESGFCEILNTTSGEVFRVMHTTRLSLKEDVRFTCQLAREFTNFRHFAARYRHDPPMATDEADDFTNGIVMAVYEAVLPSAYASIRLLRIKGCRLPIELWFRHSELSFENPVLQALLDEFGPVHLRQIHDERVTGFYVKAHALYYSRFTNVLMMDADNFAIRDPSSLFSSAPFKKHGAVFWPDFWHPGNTIFNLHAQSLLWELLDVDFVDMFEQESGQVLVNRRSSRPMLEMLMFFATHKPNLMSKLQLVWGDKDLFRLAWLVTKREFFFNDRRMPGSLGVVNNDRQRFCGMSMVQYDIGGDEILFLHRNTIKLTGVFDTKIWHTLQEYPAQSEYFPEALPVIHSFNGQKLFDEASCFGVKRYEFVPGVQMRRVVTIPSVASVEAMIITFAAQAHSRLYSETTFIHSRGVIPPPTDG